jgi:transcriptional regulator with XRE-family HTH domain
MTASDGNFSHRLSEAFGFATMAEIARRISVPHATIRNYFQGRLPAPEVLIKIANETNVSLNWLLSGAGEMYMSGKEPVNFDKLLERKIDEILERRLAPPSAEVQNLGNIDAPPPFDVEAAISQFNDPQRVVSEWFRYEGRRAPKDFGLIFFQGWETYSDTEKAEAVKDAKKVLDRALRKK